MQHKQLGASSPDTDLSFVYFYLVAGIAIAVSVFLFVPRVTIG